MWEEGEKREKGALKVVLGKQGQQKLARVQ